jgi:beta-glucosidase
MHGTIGWIALAASLMLPAAVLPGRAQRPDVEARIDALLARMTVEEKLGQLQQLAGTAEGEYNAEQEALARKGLIGSLLNVRGAARVNAIQRSAVEGSRLKIPLLLGFDVIQATGPCFRSLSARRPRGTRRAPSVPRRLPPPSLRPSG